MSYVLSQLGLMGTPEGDYNSSLEVEATGASDGVSSVTAFESQDYTTLGLGGYGVSSPLLIPVAILDAGYGLSIGSSVVDGQATILHNGVGLAQGTSTAEAAYTAVSFLTTLGLYGGSQSHPLYENPESSGEAVGSAYGTSTVEGVAEVPLVEDYGSDTLNIGPLGLTGAGTIELLSVTISPSGGLTFAGTAPRLKGFNYQAVGGLAFAGTARAVKTRTVVPTGGILFSGFGGGAPNVIKSFTYTPVGGIQFAGSPSISFFKDFGPGATGKIRDKRRITFSTRSYSRG